MVLGSALLGGLLIAGQASASINALLQPSKDMERLLRREADSVLEATTITEREEADLVRRAPQISSTPASGDASTADLSAWETQTQQACQNALGSLNGQASNPSGIAVCYNLPFLDNVTGVFQAELRMYNISPPINPWNDITPAEITISMSYLGAKVQTMNGNIQKRDITWPPIRREDDGLSIKRQAGTSAAPQQLKVLMYVGQINSNLMGSAMTQATLQPLLIPTIELIGTRPGSEPITATLSSQEASFVNGVFAKQAASPVDPSAAAASASAAVQSAAPFILPGVRLAFFPVGLVVTCIWTGLFFLAVGGGTVGRIQFREQYRRRLKREMATGMRTI